MTVIGQSHELERHARGAFVPTMGALHEGHLTLIRRAKSLAGGAPVVVSLFVNPTQFGPGEDFNKYPRMLEKDVESAMGAGADVIFAPDTTTMYPPGQSVETPPLPEVATKPKLEDAFRPTHFSGVCQVVARLFDLVKPRWAVFGEKDWQQLQVITAMVEQQRPRWENLEIVPYPTVRERDGLAMSSRNAYLNSSQRKQALALWRAMSEAKQEKTPAQAEFVMHTILEESGFAIDYAAVRDATTLMPIHCYDTPARALIAARLENVRLIDNSPMSPPLV
jgi:pantoate--beta-alanine ligase